MTGSVASAEQSSISLFSVYAPQDALYYEQFEKHLNALKRQGLTSVWSVDSIAAGANRDDEFEKHLKTAQIILLFLSVDFFASKYYDDVMRRALQRQKEATVCVIPTLLRPADWENSLLSKLQALPTNGKPVTNWPDCDDAYLLITKEIRKIIGAQFNPLADRRPITENYLSYLRWLIKRTSFLETRGIFPTQPLFQIKLDEVYISLQARHEDDLQPGALPPISEALGAETSREDQALPSLPLSRIVACHSHVMLLGEPESGKTTFLRFLALEHALWTCSVFGGGSNREVEPVEIHQKR